MTSIRCETLNKSFEGIAALVNTSITFPESGVVAIIGPNGAGKTTLLNILTGFLRPDSGQVFVGELNVSQFPPHLIARTGVARTFQELRLAYELSVLDNVLLSLPNQRGERLLSALFGFGVRKREEESSNSALRLLRFVGVGEQANSLVGELSYGQQKLVSIACCLATRAQIIFLDEPIAGVHPERAIEILSLMRTMREDGKLLIFIEHDIRFVRQIADFVIVMDDGKVIAQGHPSEVLSRTEIVDAYVG
jgi:ABC-type branched-subunit amino acid transport system ATPase component